MQRDLKKENWPQYFITVAGDQGPGNSTSNCFIAILEIQGNYFQSILGDKHGVDSKDQTQTDGAIDQTTGGSVCERAGTLKVGEQGLH